MSTHKHIDKICCVVLALTLILTALFMCGETLGIEVSAHAMGYEDRLFATDRVHTIDIVIDDWDAFISTAISEEYSVCSVVIDGEAVRNVGIRGKGNTSLSSVSSMGSQRYSFKIEFDQYDSTKSYHGLDKLSLNNVIQDNTYMKDYLTYQMMNAFGVNAPLCSYAYITVNGEDWGLYLAVEGVEDAFLQRNYGSDYGELYKPDSMSFGGGRGNGMAFDFSNFSDENGGFSFSFGNGSTMPDMGGMKPSGGSSTEEGDTSSRRPSRGESGSSQSGIPGMGNFGGMIGGMGGMGGMGASDVKLQYIDDNANSYSNIFNNAKTAISEADQNRLIASLKQLSEYRDLEEVVDMDQVLRYFVVHNYVVNGDSYTGSMIHNYYLYEENGQLSMIPWDYNLAYGTFSGSNASSSVNESIDEVLSDRPMQAWIFSNEEYSARYYALYAELLETVDVQAIIDHAYALIAPYVQKDPTTFCTYEAFEQGVAAIKTFCTLRSESVALQLSGSDETVNAAGLNISDMGTMGGGMGGGRESFRSDRDTKTDRNESADIPSEITPTSFFTGQGTPMGTDSDSGQPPMSSGSGQMPNMGDFDPNSMPDRGDFDPNSMPDRGDFDLSNLPESGMQFPGSMQNGQKPSGGSQGGSIGSVSNTSIRSETMTMLAVSVAVLAAGLLFAVFFKRRK